MLHAYVPTTAERTGDFSGWLNGCRWTFCPVRWEPECAGSMCRYVIYDPSTYDPATQTRQAYANNIIPNPDPKALAYLSHFPNPNYTSPIAGDFNNWAGTQTKGINNNNYTARLDYNLTKRDSVYFRYSHDYGTLLNEGGLVPELALGQRTGPYHRQLPGATGCTPSAMTLTNELNFSVTKAQNASNQAAQINKFMQTTWLPDLFPEHIHGRRGFHSL